MERKSVIVVRWKGKNKWEVYSSMRAFGARNLQYGLHRIYSKWQNAIYEDTYMELRRVKFTPHPLKTRKGNLKRAKPGPKRGSKRTPRKEVQ